MDHEQARARVLDAAETLFYERGIQAVSMDQIRAASGVSLKRLYQCFPSKNDLVESYLRRWDERWRVELAEYVGQHAAEPRAAVLAVFDWLSGWFDEPGFRGCAFINSLGELGAISPGVAEVARQHKRAVRDYLAGLVGDLRVPAAVTLVDQLAMLVDGAAVNAAFTGDPSAAHHAKQVAEILLAVWRPAPADGRDPGQD